MTTATAIGLGLLLTLPVAVFAQESPPARQLVLRLDQIRLPARSFGGDLRFVEFRQGKKERELSLRMCARRTAPGFDCLFVATAPAPERNKLLLAKGDSLWFYDPKSERPVPVSPFQFRNHAFVLEALSSALNLGYAAAIESDALIVDLARRPVDTVVLKLTPRDQRKPSSGMIRYWLDKKTNRPIKDEVTAPSGKLLRTIYYSDYKNILDESRPMRLVVLNQIDGTVSEIRFSNFAYHEWPDALFEEASMARAATLLR